ncbi:MAG: hypothetical protein L0287_05165 [Anaerolineae bacterium]|nr:hypothetical protein [Anaerolineae bacterium]
MLVDTCTWYGLSRTVPGSAGKAVDEMPCYLKTCASSALGLDMLRYSTTGSAQREKLLLD